MEDPWTKMTAQEKLERFCYIGDDRNIRARYIDGKLVKGRSVEALYVLFHGLNIGLSDVGSIPAKVIVKTP